MPITQEPTPEEPFKEPASQTPALLPVMQPVKAVPKKPVAKKNLKTTFTTAKPTYSSETQFG